MFPQYKTNLPYSIKTIPSKVFSSSEKKQGEQSVCNKNSTLFVPGKLQDQDNIKIKICCLIERIKEVLCFVL